MQHRWDTQPNHQEIEYSWIKNGKTNSISTNCSKEPQTILEDSEEEFISEHYWGYTKVNNSKTYEYEVQHPTWEYYKINDYKINIDFGSVYGADFKSLTNAKPKSVMLMEGSEISVENKNVIT